MQLLPENVQDYPRPPTVHPLPQRIRVVFAGLVVVETTSALRVLETHHAPTYYVPRECVQARLVPVVGTSFCEWKGVAQYWTVATEDSEARSAAWSYPNPSPRFAGLKDHVAFYAGQMDACFVGRERVLPQPGDFYGGWVTPNLMGQIKGGPGTRHL